MKKLLIIGASILQLPAIKKAKELGYYVGVVDYDPDAAGIEYADEFFNVSTIDVEKVAETATTFNPCGIMTLATDMPMRSVAKAAKECGLSGISMDTAIKSTDKGEMIKAFKECGVAHPWFYVAEDEKKFNEIKGMIEFPCIMKPTDSSGSRGVVLASCLETLEKEYGYTKDNSRQGAVIVEEYMVGPEVSVEAMTINGEPVILQVTDKLTTGAPHFVEMGHSQPSQLSTENVSAIKELAKKAIKAVGIENGPAHIEIILTKDGPKMVELGARMGGDCITSHLVPLSTGIDMIKATIETACGSVPDITPKLNKGAAIRYFNAKEGIIASIENVEEAKKIDGVQEIAFTKTIGDKIGKIGSSTDRAGFVIAQADTASDAIKICEKVLDVINIKVV